MGWMFQNPSNNPLREGPPRLPFHSQSAQTSRIFVLEIPDVELLLLARPKVNDQYVSVQSGETEGVSEADISRAQRPLRTRPATRTTSPLFSCQSKSRSSVRSSVLSSPSFFGRVMLPHPQSVPFSLSRYHDRVRSVTIAFFARSATRKKTKRKNRRR